MCTCSLANAGLGLVGCLHVINALAPGRIRSDGNSMSTDSGHDGGDSCYNRGTSSDANTTPTIGAVDAPTVMLSEAALIDQDDDRPYNHTLQLLS
jgi:hypothetical protein